MGDWMRAAFWSILLLLLLGLAAIGALGVADFIGDTLRIEPRHD